MKLTALVENTTNCGLKVAHGLSLYIETERHKLLFDLGPDETLFENARNLGADLTAVDTVIISHGHNDHGGALKRFLEVNSQAKIYVQRRAFEPHYSKTPLEYVPIGLDRSLMDREQLVLVDGDFVIDDELRLFTVLNTEKCHSTANDTLFDENGPDSFVHEQNLLITEHETVLVMGCGHTGIVNIMEKASVWQPRLCVGGFHLYNPSMKKTVPDELLDQIAGELRAYPQMRFYTCHCTGTQAYQYLAERVPGLSYLACGDHLEL